MTLEKITKGNKVQLNSEAKEELVTKYKLSGGMSRVNAVDLDGCNIFSLQQVLDRQKIKLEYE